MQVFTYLGAPALRSFSPSDGGDAGPDVGPGRSTAGGGDGHGSGEPESVMGLSFGLVGLIALFVVGFWLVGRLE